MGKKLTLNEKHIAVLHAVKTLQPCGVRSVAKLVGMTKSNAESYMSTLTNNGYIRYDVETGKEHGMIRAYRIRRSTRLTELGEAMVKDSQQTRSQ